MTQSYAKINFSNSLNFFNFSLRVPSRLSAFAVKQPATRNPQLVTRNPQLLTRNFFLLLLCLSSCFPLKAQQVEAISFHRLDSLIRHSDHPVVVNFWASWCAPCLHEIPWLEESVARYSNDKVELILVSLDPPAVFPAGLNSFIRKKGFTARCYWLEASDRKAFYAQFQPGWDGGLPSSLFVYPARQYRQFFARQLTDRQCIRELQKMLGRESQ